MKRSGWAFVIGMFLLVGSFGCNSDDADPAVSDTPAVEGADAIANRAKTTPSSVAAGTLDAVRTLARQANQPKLNVNTAKLAELATLPDVGKKMVHEFEEYRPYVSISQFRREIGKYVDTAQVAEYEKFLYVPIVVNESDAATLQQLPGVTADIAKTLEQHRPYSTNAAFLIELAKHVTDPQARTGASYLKQR